MAAGPPRALKARELQPQVQRGRRPPPDERVRRVRSAQGGDATAGPVLDETMTLCGDGVSAIDPPWTWCVDQREIWWHEAIDGGAAALVCHRGCAGGGASWTEIEAAPGVTNQGAHDWYRRAIAKRADIDQAHDT